MASVATVTAPSLSLPNDTGGSTSVERDEIQIGWAINVWAFLSIVASAVAQCRLEDVICEVGLSTEEETEQIKNQSTQDERCTWFIQVLQRSDPLGFKVFVDAITAFRPLLKILDFFRVKSASWQARSELFDWKSESFQDFSRGDSPKVESSERQPDSGCWNDYPQAEAAHSDWVIRNREDTIQATFGLLQALVKALEMQTRDFSKLKQSLPKPNKNMAAASPQSEEFPQVSASQDEEGLLLQDHLTQIAGTNKGDRTADQDGEVGRLDLSGGYPESAQNSESQEQLDGDFDLSGGCPESAEDSESQEQLEEMRGTEQRVERAVLDLIKPVDHEGVSHREVVQLRQDDKDEAVGFDGRSDDESVEAPGWAGVTTISAEDTSAHDQTHEKLLEQLAFSKHKQRDLTLEVDTLKGQLQQIRDDYESAIETFRGYQQKLVETVEELQRGKANQSRGMAASFKLKEKLLLRKHTILLTEERRQERELFASKVHELEVLLERFKEEEERTANLSRTLEQVKDEKRKQLLETEKQKEQLEREKQDAYDQVASLAAEKERALRETEEMKKEVSRRTTDLEDEVQQLRGRLVRLQEAKENVEKTRDFYFHGWQENLARKTRAAVAQNQKAPSVAREEERPLSQRTQPMSLGHPTAELATGQVRPSAMYSSFAAPSAETSPAVPGTRVTLASEVGSGWRDYTAPTVRSGPTSLPYFPPVTESLQRHVSQRRIVAGSTTSGVSSMDSGDQGSGRQTYAATLARQRELRGQSLPYAIDESATSHAQLQTSSTGMPTPRQQSSGLSELPTAASFLQENMQRFSGLQANTRPSGPVISSMLGRTEPSTSSVLESASPNRPMAESLQCPYCGLRFSPVTFSEHVQTCTEGR